MGTIKVKNMKVGEKYYFVDTEFHYNPVKMPVISEERINKIIGGDFSTKNEGDRYERVRVMAFKTEREAKQYALKELKNYRTWLKNCVNMHISFLEEELLF